MGVSVAAMAGSPGLRWNEGMTTSTTPHRPTAFRNAPVPPVGPGQPIPAAPTNGPGPNTPVPPHPVPAGLQGARPVPVARQPRRYATSGATMLMLSLLSVGLVAGVYFAFQVAVIPGLSRASDATFAEALDRINESIENPVFFAAFFGALVVTAIAATQQWRRGNRTAAVFALLALGLYLVGFGATIVGDIPLNEQLAAVAPAHAGPVIDRIRTPWLAWNVVRTLASIAALLCLGRAALAVAGRTR
jgi:uncharacterized membrane protein